jgi:hypothetical protein
MSLLVHLEFMPFSFKISVLVRVAVYRSGGVAATLVPEDKVEAAAV